MTLSCHLVSGHPKVDKLLPAPCLSAAHAASICNGDCRRYSRRWRVRQPDRHPVEHIREVSTAALPAANAEQVLEPFPEHQEDVYQHLAARAAALHAVRSARILIGIAGVPGSGKSTTAAAVCRLLNSERFLGSDRCLVVPMDGFHYYRAELDAGVAGDPAQAHARRGAHWTFNAPAFVACVRSLKEAGGGADSNRARNGDGGEPQDDSNVEAAVAVPSFAHGVGDPVPDDIRVAGRHRVLLVEGNYLLLGEPPWTELLPLFDDTWFIDCDLDTAMERVLERQVADGRDPDVVTRRVASNDRPNAELIAQTKSLARVIVPSRPFKQDPLL